ncbi:hypothetical protein YC2023_011660 [Brassica napus]
MISAVVVGKSVSSPPLSNTEDLFVGDLAGTSSTETEAGFGISTVPAAKKVTKAAKKDSSSDESDSDESESEDEEETPKKKNADVEMVDSEEKLDDTNRNIQSVRGDSLISALELEDHQPPSLLQMELQSIDRFSESSRPQVHQEVVTVRDQLEKKERDLGLSSQSERRQSQRFMTKTR